MSETNTPALTMPQHVTSLATSGVIVNVRQRVLTFTESDKKVSSKASADAGAQRDVGKFSHELFSDEPALRDLLNHRQTVYNWMNLRFFPWGKGEYYCPTIVLPTALKEFDALKKTHTALKAKWGSVYDTAIGNQAFVRGAFFNRADYMERDAMLSRYQLDMIVTEVPVGDFRNAIAADTAKDLFTSLSQQHERRIKVIGNEQSKRLLEVLESLSHCCELVQTTDKDGKPVTKRRKLYNATVEKALQLVDVYQSFNFSDMPELEQARAALAKTLDGVNVEALKESDTLRTVVKEQVDDIIAMFRPTTFDIDEDDAE